MTASLATAKAKRRNTLPGYVAVLRTLPRRHEVAVKAYVAALNAEAAALRVITRDLRAALGDQDEQKRLSTASAAADATHPPLTAQTGAQHNLEGEHQ